MKPKLSSLRELSSCPPHTITKATATLTVLGPDGIAAGKKGAFKRKGERGMAQDGGSPLFHVEGERGIRTKGRQTERGVPLTPLRRTKSQGFSLIIRGNPPRDGPRDPRRDGGETRREGGGLSFPLP